MGNGTLTILAAAALLSAGCDTRVAPPQASLDLAAPEARYQLDAARKRLWVLTDDGVFLQDLARPGRAISLPDWVWAGRAHACLPVLALGPEGEVLVTSNVVPTLWRIHPETLAVSVHPLALDADNDKDVGFSGLAWSPEQGAFVALSSAHGSLWRIDPQLTSARKVALVDPVRGACGLCVHTPQQGWDIDFAPDQRSAYVRLRARAGLRPTSYYYVPGGTGSCAIG